MEKVILKKDCNKKIKSGHLWIFSNELTNIPKIPAGEIVEVLDTFGKSYGKGFYNPNSLISVRLLNTNGEINTDFFISRISKALEHRSQLMQEIHNIRLVYGESDYLPGLIIDKFENSFVIQFLSAGMELSKLLIVEAILHLFPNCNFILSKTNSKLREMEGLPLVDEILFGNDIGKILTTDNGIKLEISISEGQKTGYFLDQRNNRYQVRNLSNNKTVLDCYTNQGGFALNASIGGAKSVTAVDISMPALEQAENNAKLNNFEIDFVHSDVFEFLNLSVSQNKKWDIVILDPPAFTKSKKNVATAAAAYSKLNKLGMLVLNDGGFLVSSSCSHHIIEEHFVEIIKKEASKLGKQLKLIHRANQAPDHPQLLSMPETTYLKFYIFKVETV